MEKVSSFSEVAHVVCMLHVEESMCRCKKEGVTYTHDHSASPFSSRSSTATAASPEGLADAPSVDAIFTAKKTTEPSPWFRTEQNKTKQNRTEHGRKSMPRSLLLSSTYYLCTFLERG